MANAPLVTVAVPSYNQGRYLDAALTSIFEQDLPLEVYVLDGGSNESVVADAPSPPSAVAEVVGKTT